MTGDQRPEVVGSGFVQSVTPARQEHQIDRFERLYRQAERDHTHLWTATVLHLVQPQTDTMHPLEGATLDVDSIALPPVLGCFVCEREWSPALATKRCPGDPRGRKMPKRGAR